MGYFPRLRHRQHHLLVIAHAADAFLPTMRAQLTDVYLFRQNPKQAEVWTDLYADDAIMPAAGLEQFQYLHKRAFRPVTRGRLTPAQVAQLPGAG
jgi:hypothetical protein